MVGMRAAASIGMLFMGSFIFPDDSIAGDFCVYDLLCSSWEQRLCFGFVTSLSIVVVALMLFAQS